MNKYDQSNVAYETGPKEVPDGKGMPSGDKSFGKGNKMPQHNKNSDGSDYKEKSYPANPLPLRYGEHR